VCLPPEIAERTWLQPIMDLIIRRRNSLFGHVAGLGKDTPVHQALQRQINISLRRLPNRNGNVSHVAQEASGWIIFALLLPVIEA